MLKLLGLVIVATPLAAQSDQVSLLGIRVRVATGRSTATGTLSGLAGDSVRLATNGSTLAAIPLGAIRTFEVSRGRHPFVGRGAFLGMAGAAGLTAVARLADCASDPCRNPVGRIVVNGLAGAIGGALVGAVFRRERWEEIPLPTSSGTTPVASPDLLVTTLGLRIRVIPEDGGPPVAGRLARVAGDSIALADENRGGETRVFRRGSVRSVEVWRGRAGHAAKGLLIGGLLGGGAGLALGSGVGESEFSDEPEVIVGVAGALLGVVAGATVGSVIRTDRWERVPLDGLRLSATVGPAGGLVVGLRMAMLRLH